jgi:hypothetical protein
VGDTKMSVMRRAASVAAVTGAIAAGTAFAATPASADALHQTEASVLMKVTPNGADAGVQDTNACCNNDGCTCNPK